VTLVTLGQSHLAMVFALSPARQAFFPDSLTGTKSAKPFRDNALCVTGLIQAPTLPSHRSSENDDVAL
jgi:hypothetical protein